MPSLWSWLLPVCVVLAIDEYPVREPFSPSYVFITISELGYREIELNWNMPDRQIGSDRIQLVGVTGFSEASDENEDNVVFSKRVDTSQGRYKTGISMPIFPATPDDSERCWSYAVEYIRIGENGTQVLMHNCFRLYPRWMARRRAEIGNLPLSSLMIPGTHDSAAALVHTTSAFVRRSPRFIITQDESVYNQLISGIRYLDLRVRRSRNNKFYVYHWFTIGPLGPILQDIRRFVQEYNEVVIMDFHAVDGISTPLQHTQLLKYVERFLGRYLARGIETKFTTNATLNALWKAGTPVVWTYPKLYRKYVKGKPFLWDFVRHVWPNTNSALELPRRLQLRKMMYTCQNYLWSQMAEVTLRASNVIFHHGFGLNKHAHVVNKQVNLWYRSAHWWKFSNIIATDFFLGNNIIEISIQVNENGGNGCQKSRFSFNQESGIYKSQDSGNYYDEYPAIDDEIDESLIPTF